MPEKQNLPGHSVLKEHPALTEDHENIAVNILKGKKNYNGLLRRNINSKMVYLALNSSSPQFHFLVLKPLAVSPRFHGRDVPPQSSHGLKQY